MCSLPSLSFFFSSCDSPVDKPAISSALLSGLGPGLSFRRAEYVYMECLGTLHRTYLPGCHPGLPSWSDHPVGLICEAEGYPLSTWPNRTSSMPQPNLQTFGAPKTNEGTSVFHPMSSRHGSSNHTCLLAIASEVSCPVRLLSTHQHG